LLIASALWALRVCPPPSSLADGTGLAPFATGYVGTLLRLPGFRRVVLVAALILGSHALHDGFAMIRWRAAGVEPGTAGLLWSEAVAAEIVVFFAIGRLLLDCLGTNGAAMLAAAAAGVQRWTQSAETAALPALALSQPLHELTFALLHLVCMRRLAEIVPATAVGNGADLVRHGRDRCPQRGADPGLGRALRGAAGAGGFWVMAGLCGAVLAIARRL
jgi:PPP family 3-phenylpropionic acid transporter